MQKLATICLILFIGVQCLSAQEDIVKKIRKEYNDYNKLISDSKAEGLDFFPPSFSIKSTQNRRALGPVNISIDYFYDEHSNFEDAEGQELIKNWAILRKVIYTEGMPSYQEYKEFLYDKNGDLLFYYSKLTGYTCGEKRMYFDKGKLVKIMFNPISGENCGGENDFPTYTRYQTKLTKEDLEWQKWVLQSAKRHKQTLNNLYDSTQ